MAVSLPEPAVHSVPLRGGRRLSVAEYGDRNGFPVLVFHGFPGSKWIGRLLAEPAESVGVRIVAPDRPGIGSSSYQFNRFVRDWPHDVSALVSYLGCEEVATLGFGAGAAYALAVAHDVDNRLSATGVVGGLPPASVPRNRSTLPFRLLFDAARYLPFGAFPRVLAMAYRLDRDPDAVLVEEVDRGQALAQPTREFVYETMRASYLSTFKQGLRGPLREALILKRGWGFRLEGVSHPVQLYHGERDRTVSVSDAETVASRLPDCSTTVYPGEDHESVLVNRGADILAGLVP